MTANIVQATAEFEKMHKGLEVIARSRGVENIGRLVKETERLAKLPGLGLRESFASMQQLLGAGVTDGAALKIIEGFGTGIARAGLGAAEFGRVMTQVTQAISLGKIQMQDFKTIFSTIPEARPILERVFGSSDLDTLRKMGKTSAELIGTLARELDKLGTEGLDDSLANKLENLNDSFFKLKATLGTTVFENTINKSLGSLSSLMDSVTQSLITMSPWTKNFISSLVLLTAKIAIIVPAVGMMVKTVKLLGATFLSGSILVKNFAQIIGFARISSAKTTNQLILMSTAMNGTSVAARFAAGSTLALAAAGRTLKTVFRTVIPVLGEIYIAYELLSTLFPSIRTWVSKFTKFVIKDIKNLSKALGDFIKVQKGWIMGEGQKGGMSVKGRYAGLGRELIKDEKDPLADWLATINKGLDDTAKSGKQAKVNFFDPFTSFLINIGKEISDGKIQEAMDDIREFLRGSNKIPKIQSGDQRSGVFGQGGTGVSSMHGGSTDSTWGITADMALQAATLTENANKIFSEENLARAREFSGIMSEMWMGPISDGIDDVANAFGNLIEDGLNGTQDAFKNFGKNIGQAVSQMIGYLVKLIAKMAIAAALVNIIFPGGGGLSALMSGGGGFASGGLFEGKGGFLKGIFGGLFGGLGFSEGGIVPGTSVYGGDSVPAMLTPGEMVLTKDQQKALGSARNHININGVFTARGRDLMYVIENYQIQTNSNR